MCAAENTQLPPLPPIMQHEAGFHAHPYVCLRLRLQGFTHLLLPPQSFSRSMKQLLAVAAGAAIVTPAWLEASHSESEWRKARRW